MITIYNPDFSDLKTTGTLKTPKQCLDTVKEVMENENHNRIMKIIRILLAQNAFDGV